MKITNLEITFDIFDDVKRIGYVALTKHGKEFTINSGTTITTEDLSKLNSFTNAALLNYDTLIKIQNETNQTQNKDA